MMFDTKRHDIERLDAVVVAHRHLDHPLWDPGASVLRAALEDLLEGVVVTTAAVGGGGPEVRDAVGAARFAGASAALVIVPDEISARAIDGGVAPMPFRVAVSSSWSADAIAAVFQRERRSPMRRACA
jgi:hypothetical protein